MPYTVQGIRVLMSGPSDVKRDRDGLLRAIEAWNMTHSERLGVVLVPRRWENVAPGVGTDPQAVVGRSIVQDCDMLIGLAWTRLGTPTPRDESGTAEEIRECIQAGKPVMLYHCRRPVELGTVDHEQVAALNTFLDEVKHAALVPDYADIEELVGRFPNDLTQIVEQNLKEWGALPSTPPPVVVPVALATHASPLARVETEREISGYNKKGNPRYSTKHRLIIENKGTRAAEALRVVLDATKDGEEPPDLLLGSTDGFGRVPPGGQLAGVLAVDFNSAATFTVTFRWREGDDEFTEQQTLSLF